MLPSNNARSKRRRPPIHVHAVQREPKRCSYNERYTATAATTTTITIIATAAAAAAVLRRAASFWVEMEGASRRNVTRIPSPVPSAPAAAPWPAAVGPYFSPSSSPSPYPAAPSRATGSFVRSLAPSRRQSCRHPCVATRPCLSFGLCPRETRGLFPSPFLFLSPFPLLSTPGSYAGCLVPFFSPSLSCLSFRPPPLPPPASAAVSMPRSDDGRSQTHREGEKEARVTPAFWLGIVTGRPAYVRAIPIHVRRRESTTRYRQRDKTVEIARS